MLIFFIRPLGVTSASRHSARASGSSGAGTTPGRKGAGGREKSSEEKTSSKHQPSLVHSPSISDVQGRFHISSMIYV